MGQRFWNFLTGTCPQLTPRYEETSSLRSDVCSSLLEGWEWGAWQTPSSGQTPNCVKLLRWKFFFSVCSSISFRIAFTVRRCVSAQKPWIVAGWVRVVGRWVDCYWVRIFPLFLRSLSLLGDLAWWAGGYRSMGVGCWVSGLLGASSYHHQQHPPPTFPC